MSIKHLVIYTKRSTLRKVNIWPQSLSYKVSENDGVLSSLHMTIFCNHSTINDNAAEKDPNRKWNLITFKLIHIEDQSFRPELYKRIA